MLGAKLGKSLCFGVASSAALLMMVGSAALAAGEGTHQPALEKLRAGLEPGSRPMEYVRSLSRAEQRELRTALRSLSEAERTALRAEMGLEKQAVRNATEESQRGSVGTVQYDTGTPHALRVPVVTSGTTLPRGTGNPGRIVGNLFTGLQDPHTVSTVTVQMNGVFTFGTRGGGTSNASLYFAGAPSGGVAPVFGTFAETVSPGSLAQLSGVSLTGLTGPLVVGAWQTEGSGTPYEPETFYANIAVDINSNASLSRGNGGFHGITFAGTLGDRGARGSASQLVGANVSPTIPTGSPGSVGTQRVPFNAILRVTGPNLPVELMSFEVED